MSVIARIPELITAPWIFAGLGSELFMALSKTGGGAGTFVNTADTPGITAASDNQVFYANGLLYHWCDGDDTKVSSDRGATWQSTTGFVAGTDCYELIYSRANSEWQAYTLAGLYFSDNGRDFFFRATAGRILRSPAVKPELNRIVAIAGTVIGPIQNEYALSLDGGLTWSLIQDAALNLTDGMQCALAMRSGFLMFGRDSATGNLRVRKSAGGGSLTWSDAVLPAGITVPAHYGTVYNYDSDDCGIVFQSGAFRFCFNWGAVWSGTNVIPYGSPTAIGRVPELCLKRMRYYLTQEFADPVFFVYLTQGGGLNELYRRDTSAEGVFSEVYQTPTSDGPNSIAIIPL